MKYCHCHATEYHFDQARAEAELQRYKKKGPGKSTRILLDILKTLDLHGVRLLDIGAGLGTIARELFPEGLASAVLVEISSSFLSAAESEARLQGYDRTTFRCIHGDFLEMADKIPEADLVTMDRVVCCYPDMKNLIRTSSGKSARWYALSYPRDRWYVRLDDRYRNWRRRRKGDLFRTYVHSQQRIHELLKAAGFTRQFRKSTFFWCVELYGRSEHT